MTKPEDIPQRVWGLALRVWAEMRTVEHDRSVEWAHGDVEEIARAIMAAEQREREACARRLDEEADKQKAAWDAFISSGRSGPATSYESIYRGMAVTILNRGENQGD